MGAYESILKLSFPWPFMIMFGIVFARVQITYWAGRGALAGVRKTRLREKLESPGFVRAQGFIARWGAFAVVISFLTVGFQTLVNLAAGFGKMPFVRRYLPASIVGSLLWAALYTTLGAVVIESITRAIGGDYGALLLLLGVAAVVVCTAVIHRKFFAASSPGVPSEPVSSEPVASEQRRDES